MALPVHQLPLVILVLILMSSGGGTGLSYNHYQLSCPNVETIVKEILYTNFVVDPTAPSAFLRLLFHDCQVQGCDASILLDNDTGGGATEMAASKNFGIRKRELIGKIKSVLELVCPGQVSCADIVALAAREAVAYSGGPWIGIPLGRKDSATSGGAVADSYLPSSEVGMDDMLGNFSTMGMTVEETVAILGSHTLGVGHCTNIVKRLYDPQRKVDAMNYGYELFLRLTCPTRIPLTNLTIIPNDLTSLLFDNQYYRDVMCGRGLFGVDSSMWSDPRTAPAVARFAADQSYFFRVYSSAFVKLSSFGVLNGGDDGGQIRRVCNRAN